MTLVAGIIVGLTGVNLLGAFACVCIRRARAHRVAHVPLSDSSSRRAPPGKKPPSKPSSKLWGSRKDDAEAGLSMVAYDAAQEETTDELPAASDSIALAPQSFRSNIELPNSYAESIKATPERVAIQRDRTRGARYMGQVDDPTLEVEID
jgi:hypothetical protein